MSADTDTQFDIYERSGTATTLLSTGPDGGNRAFSASVEGASQDGSKVFPATSESLVSADTDSQRDIYERRRSMPVGGGGGGGCGIGPELAALLPALGWLYCRRRRP